MARYCPMCGKSDSAAKFLGELCERCAFSREAPLAPVRVSLCQKCGSLIDKSRKKKEAKLGEEVVRLLKLRSKNAIFDAEKSEVEYDFGGGRMRRAVLVLTDKSLCTECGRAGTQYFEAIIQLRGDGRRLERMADSLIRQMEKESFVPKIEEKKEGVDIYCGSRKSAIAALNLFELGFLRTEKLAGERDGKRLYRTTLLVRL